MRLATRCSRSPMAAGIASGCRVRWLRLRCRLHTRRPPSPAQNGHVDRRQVRIRQSSRARPLTKLRQRNWLVVPQNRTAVLSPFQGHPEPARPGDSCCQNPTQMSKVSKIVLIRRPVMGAVGPSQGARNAHEPGARRWCLHVPRAGRGLRCRDHQVFADEDQARVADVVRIADGGDRNAVLRGDARSASPPSRPRGFALGRPVRSAPGWPWSARWATPAHWNPACWPPPWAWKSRMEQRTATACSLRHRYRSVGPSR